MLAASIPQLKRAAICDFRKFKTVHINNLIHLGKDNFFLPFFYICTNKTTPFKAHIINLYLVGDSNSSGTIIKDNKRFTNRTKTNKIMSFLKTIIFIHSKTLLKFEFEFY